MEDMDMYDIMDAYLNLLNELLTDYFNSEQYTLELLMSEQADLYKEIEDEELRKLGLLGIHYRDMASNVYSSLKFPTKIYHSLRILKQSDIHTHVTLYVDAHVFNTVGFVHALVNKFHLNYVIVSNIMGVDSLCLTRGYRGQINDALHGVTIEVTSSMDVCYLADIANRVTKVTGTKTLDVGLINQYLKNFTNLNIISIRILLYRDNEEILSMDSVKIFYKAREHGCRLLFDVIGGTHYSALKFTAIILLLYFGEVELGKNLSLKQYSYENVLACYRSLSLDSEVAEDEEVIVKGAMKDIECYIKECCGL